MMKRLLPLLLCVSVLFGCDREPATVPSYLHIDEMNVSTNYVEHGTASSNITTAWVEIDGDMIGVFELPAVVPVAKSGQHELKLYPGINLNGIQSLRNIYEFYQPYEEVMTFVENEDVWPDAANDSVPTVTYSPQSFYTYRPIEDFEDISLAFEISNRADTGLSRTTDPNLVFNDPELNENSTQSGYVRLPDEDFLFEVISVEEFTDLPKGGANVYLEMNYKIDAVATVGVFRRIPGQVDQVPVVGLFPTDGEWKKIYINLVTEVSAVPNAEGFRIFIGAVNVEGNGEMDMLFDNIKLVY
ncbi:MAG: hypothetical protein HWD92_00315 [Flavobacteriia bacterium]|nr:hypothetical protein [Flavobacteriia bacterium]